MSNRATPIINGSNVNVIREQIRKKNGFSPFLTTIEDAGAVITDHDVFPYPRYFQGVPTSDVPIVAEREAGFRKVNNACYQLNLSPQFDNPFPYNYPNHCFQAPCSTVHPCFPELVDRYKSNSEFDIILNRNCIAQYR